MLSQFRSSVMLFLVLAAMPYAAAEQMQPVRLESKIHSVQPMTGIVLWRTNEKAETAPIQLEYAYLKYDQVVREKGKYDWQQVERLLDEVASRKHQAVLRWHDTYVGRPTGVPAFIKALPNYREITAKSEGRQTGFPDWSNSEWQSFVTEFYTKFAAKYDQDPRLAFLQVGFGLWSEYHIYDGPMELGKTFPSLDYQRRFARHLARQFQETPWMISVDAANDWTPFAEPEMLADLSFGLFDDSFNHRRHRQENEPNWMTLGSDRWKYSPTGGEFSFFKKKDQTEALALSGPYGIPFSKQASKYHISFMIGDHQPKYRTMDVLRAASMTCGYRFQITRFVTSPTASELTIENTGIAPIYYDAYPTIDGVRSTNSLKGLLPGQSKGFRIAKGGASPALTIECDRLVPGQKIEYAANLP